MSLETGQGAEDGVFGGYAPRRERPPFAAYAGFTAAFNAAFAAALVAAGRSGRLPERVDPSDVVLVGIATHKLSRLITKDRVMAFARAPFTEYQEPGGAGEVEEKARGDGLRKAIGELLVCPYCLGLWTSAGMHAGLLFAPRVTRTVASTFTALALADFLQIAYKAAEDRGLGGA
jgi:hypothetical protein